MMVAALPSLLLLSMWFFFAHVSTPAEAETQPGPHSTLPSSRGSACALSPNCKSFNILAFNVWGIPESFGAEYKDERILGLALELAKGQYDIVVLEELWMEADHRMLEDALLDANYTMTRFRQLSVSECDGRISPLLCSGLAVASKMRFSQDDVQFTSFGDHGDGLKAFVDGEVLAKKGIGRVRVSCQEVIVVVIVASN